MQLSRDRRLPWLLALTAATFWRVLVSSYLHWDDDRLVMDSPLMHADFHTAMAGYWTGFIEGDYIPLPLSSLWLEGRLFGDGPFPHHLGNLLIHLLNVALLHAWLGRLGVTPRLRGLAALIFAVHPLQVEPVMWISDRKSLLNATAVFGSLLCYERRHGSARPWAWEAGYVLLFATSCLAKATAVFLPVALLLAEVVTPRPDRRRSLIVNGVAIALVTAPFAYVRTVSLAAHVGITWDVALAPDRWAALALAAPAALGHYYKTFFWPFELSAIYPGYAQFSGVPWLAALGLVLTLAWLAYVWRRGAFADRLFFLWYLLLLAPVLNLVPRANFVNDRYMYLPIVGAGFALLSFGRHLLERWPALQARPRLALAAALPLAVLPVAASARARVWHDDLVFWRDAAEKSPKSPLAWNNLGMTERAAGHPAEAETCFLNGLAAPADQTSPRAVLFRNLGDLHFDPQGWREGFDPPRALQAFQRGLAEAERPVDVLTLRLRVAIALAQVGRIPEARTALESLSTEFASAPGGLEAEVRDNARSVLGALPFR